MIGNKKKQGSDGLCIPNITVSDVRLDRFKGGNVHVHYLSPPPPFPERVLMHLNVVH